MTYLPGPRAARTAAYPALLTATALATVALTTAGLTATAPAAALTARAAAPRHIPARAHIPAHLRHSAQTSLCRRYQHLSVTTAQGTNFVIKNDNYGGQRECLSVQGRRPNFTLTRSPVPAWHKLPQAYPFIMRGCSWGTCSADSGLPRQVDTLRRPVATWSTTQVPHGRWDAAFDIWFGRHPMTTGQARGAELMIWLNSRHIKLPRHTPVVRIDHARWYLVHRRACHDGACWNYVQFRRVHPVTSVRRLRLLPFIDRAEAHALIEPQWWLENIEAGFELWQGGTGLATDRFWARP
jgi:hypothetical protein